MTNQKKFGPWTVQEVIGGNCHTDKCIVTRQDDEDQYVLYHLYHKSRSKFGNEVEILQQLDHPNITPLIDHDLDCETPYYVTDWYETSLMSGIGGLRLEQLRVENITPKLKQITKAIGFMHSQGILHNAIDHNKVIMLKDGELYLRYFWRATRYTTHYVDTKDDMQAWIDKYNLFLLRAKQIHYTETKKREDEAKAAHANAQPSAPARLNE